MGEHWGSDTPISQPVPPSRDKPVVVDMGGFGWTTGGLSHNVTEVDLDALVPFFAPPLAPDVDKVRMRRGPATTQRIDNRAPSPVIEPPPRPPHVPPVAPPPDEDPTHFISVDRPVNDDFANRIMLPSATTATSDRISNLHATVEVYEPIPMLGPISGPHGSLWWAWTAPDESPVEISVSDSDPAVGAVLGVYRGSSLGALVEET